MLGIYLLAIRVPARWEPKARGGTFSQEAFRCCTILALQSRLEPRFLALTPKTEIWEDRSFRRWPAVSTRFIMD